MHKRGQFLAGAGVAFVMIAASIAGAHAQGAGALAALDLNGDGAISKAEAEKAITAQFNRMDTNHDHVLSENEFVNARLAEISRLDTNHDGNITRDEIRSRFRARFFGRD